MQKMYYTTSLELREHLLTFESLHMNLWLKKIPPKIELKLQSEAMINRLYHTLRLADIDCRRTRVSELVFKHNIHNKNERMILDMRSFFDSFYYEWTYDTRPITADFIIKLIYQLEKKRITLNVNAINNNLTYIHLEESPLIQAALAYLLFMNELNNPTASIVATLVSWMFLFKKGYSFRRAVSFQRKFMNDRLNYYDQLTNAIHNENVTPWILYFSRSFNEAVREELTFIDNLSDHTFLQSDILSPRQIQILSLFSTNDLVTNRIVQKNFNISQVTASRDLSYLTSLGLLLVQGKGRSVKYLKV